MNDDLRPTDAPTTAAAATSASSPHSFGPFRFLERLGEGGMGEVWLADQLHPLRRQVAVKIVKAGMDTRQVVARFEAERQALALMDHPAIAKVFDAGTTPEGRPYFAMEYVRGEPITTYCDRHRLSIPDRLELFIQLCDGVQHAHVKGIIHRDLKPSNILVSATGDRPVPRIIDFGIAKAVIQPLTEQPLFTGLGGFLGTPEYMSPEQAELSVDVDTRSDVYSLGVVLYELLVGCLPFDSVTMRKAGIEEVRRTIRETDPLRPSTRVTTAGETRDRMAEARRIPAAKLATALRGDLDWITMKALEKDRTRRYQTASALALDVRRHLSHEPVAAGPPTAIYRARKFVRRHRVGAISAASAALLLVVVVSLIVAQSRVVARERDRANQQAATAKYISDFLIGLFRVSDPGEARGSSVTAREILDKGATEIAQTLHDQPEVRSRLEAAMGAVYTSLGIYASGVPLLERAADAQRHLLGPNDLDAIATMNQLANGYWFQGRYAEAEPLYREVVERRQRLLGREHPDTLRANYDLASLYSVQGRSEEAERLKRTTLEIQRRVLGEDHPDTLASMSNLASTYYRQRRFTESLPLAMAAAAGRSRVLGPDHPQTLISQHNLATTYDALGRSVEAETLLLATIGTETRVLGTAHQWTALSRAHLSGMYLREKRFSEAEPLALAAHDAYAQSLGPSNGKTQAVVKQLVSLYEAWRKPAAAESWRAKLTK